MLLAGIGILIVSMLVVIGRGLMKYWQRRFIHQLRYSGVALRAVKGLLYETTEHLKEYPINPPKPYGLKVESVKGKLIKTQDECDRYLRQRCRLLREDVFVSQMRQYRRWCRFGFKLFAWRRLNRTLAEICGQLHEVVDHGAHTRLYFEALTLIPIQIYHQVRTFKEIHKKNQELLQHLLEENFQGDFMGVAVNALKEHDRLLREKVPICFQGPEIRVLQDADVETSTVAYQVIETEASSIQEYNRNLNQLISDYKEIGVVLEELGKTLHTTQQLLHSVSSRLSIAPLRQVFRSLSEQSRKLCTLHAHPTVEMLSDIYADTQQVITETKDLAEKTLQFESIAIKLNDNLHLSSELLGKVQDLMKMVTNSQRYLLMWDVSDGNLLNLYKKKQEIGVSGSLWEPFGLRDKLSKSESLLEQIRELEQVVTKIRLQFKELCKLLETSYMVRDSKWIEEIKMELQPVFGLYALENWDKSDHVETFISDAVALQERRNKVVSTLGARFCESEITGHLSATKSLFEALKAFDKRYGRITSVLKKMRDAEEQGRQQLEDLSHPISELTSFRTLYSQAINEYHEQIHSLHTQGNNLKIEIDQRKDGRVLDKANRINSWANRCKTLIQTAYNKIKDEVSGVETNLANSVKRLREKAPFDGEDILLRTDQLLVTQYAQEVNAGPIFGNQYFQTVSKTNFLLGRLERLLEYQEDLELKIEGPITGIHEEVLNLRATMCRWYDKLIMLRDQASIRCSTVPEEMKGELEAVEQAFNVFKSSRTILSFQSSGSRLISRYNRLINVLEKECHEQAEILAFERRISDLVKAFETYKNQNEGDAEIQRAVDERIERINKTLPTDGGSMEYYEVRTRLEEAWNIAYQNLGVERGKNNIQIIRVGDIVALGPVSFNQNLNIDYF